jgi:hypothetical protein
VIGREIRIICLSKFSILINIFMISLFLLLHQKKSMVHTLGNKQFR